jgi:uncharacterized protein (TIGR04141 family)
MTDTIKPTIYLIKQSIKVPEDIFKEPNKLAKIESEGGLLYYIQSVRHPAKWLPFLTTQFTVDQAHFWNASAYAVIVLNVAERFFAIPLGMGSHLIDMSNIDYNFGLKVAINAIPKNDLRQVDLTTPEATSQKTKKQAVKSSTPEEFGINKQKDILRGVVGKLPEDHEFGKRIEGKDSVKVTREIADIQELGELCSQLLSTSRSDKYKADYPWIDNMAIVSDPVMIERLYDELINSMKNNDLDHMYISPPQFIDNLYDYDGFVFTGDRRRIKNKESYSFPSIADFVNEFGEEFIAALDKEVLKKQCKVCLRDVEGELKYGWPLSRCIVWEVEIDGNKYILSDGDWFKVDSHFYESVTKFFDDHVGDLGLSKFPGDITKESDYNSFLCQSTTNMYLFDLGHKESRNRYITADQNEICDVFDGAAKRFIHIKIGKSSASISHLLRQGVFSGTTLKMDSEALTIFRQYLEVDNDASDLTSQPYTPSDYEIVFAVVLDEKQSRDVPFFSKVSFRDATELHLEMMGYRCRFGYIIKEPKKVEATSAAAYADLIQADELEEFVVLEHA